MKREILFRGKRVDNGEWVYGSKYNDFIISYLEVDKFLEESDLFSCNCVIHEVIPETVSQFTGLTDKNGVKIFEGDRLRDDWSDGEMIIEDYVTVVWDIENGQWAVDNSFKQDGSSFTNLVEYIGLDNLEVLK